MCIAANPPRQDWPEFVDFDGETDPILGDDDNKLVETM